MLTIEDYQEFIKHCKYIHDNSPSGKSIMEIIMSNIKLSESDIESSLIDELSLLDRGIKKVEQLFFAYSYVEFGEKFISFDGELTVPINATLLSEINLIGIDCATVNGELSYEQCPVDAVLIDLQHEHPTLQNRQYEYSIENVWANMNSEQIEIRVQKTYKGAFLNGENRTN